VDERRTSAADIFLAEHCISADEASAANGLCIDSSSAWAETLREQGPLLGVWSKSECRPPLVSANHNPRSPDHDVVPFFIHV
jgi:hypothetical protein